MDAVRAALGISYWNYSRYLKVKRNPDRSGRNLQIALYARNDAGIGEAEFQAIVSSHYRLY
ncbi:hypothetical protein CUU52_15195 [Pectobacterium polaris]|nr:hypothetical protein [Pectobacterium polaris]